MPHDLACPRGVLRRFFISEDRTPPDDNGARQRPGSFVPAGAPTFRPQGPVTSAGRCRLDQPGKSSGRRPRHRSQRRRSGAAVRTDLPARHPWRGHLDRRDGLDGLPHHRHRTHRLVDHRLGRPERPPRPGRSPPPHPTRHRSRARRRVRSVRAHLARRHPRRQAPDRPRHTTEARRPGPGPGPGGPLLPRRPGAGATRGRRPAARVSGPCNGSRRSCSTRWRTRPRGCAYSGKDCTTTSASSRPRPARSARQPRLTGSPRRSPPALDNPVHTTPTPERST
ncbi:hypothetical protein B0E53_00422 [Micromonospora sp. MH33]|nr:hypothetical protein B0E53_00422 [Micromonospora sp. MH33]